MVFDTCDFCTDRSLSRRLASVRATFALAVLHPNTTFLSVPLDRTVMLTGRKLLAVTDGASSDPAGAESSADTARTRAEKLELGVTLLAHLEREELDLSEAIDRIETITTSPSLTREILDTADKQGVIDREDGRLRVRRGGSFVRFESQVVARDGEFSCRRCGAGLSTGHFIVFEAGELGPFCSDCIRKVVGRDP